MKRPWLPIVGGLAAAGVAVATARGRGQALDLRLFRFVNRKSGPVADGLFKGMTELGSIWASSAAAATIAVRRHRREAVDALGAALTMWGLGQILKRVIGRPRPYASLEEFRLLIARPRGTSWPSSHPAVLLSFVTVASRDLGVPPALKSALVGLAGVVGVSRVYLGVHFPADVAGGLLLGRAVGDAWSVWISPLVLGRTPSIGAPLQ